MDYSRVTQINEQMPMSAQDVEAFRLAQYLHGQQLQQAQAQPSSATGLGQTAGQLSGMYAGNKIVGALSAAPAQGQLTSEGIAAITGNNGLYTPIAQNMSTGASGVPEVAGSSFGSSLGSAGPVAGLALATYLAGNAGLSMAQGKRPKGIEGLAGRAVLAGSTLGLSEILNYALNNHKSTRDVAKKHTKSLLNQGKDNPAWQAYVQGMRKQHESAPTGKAFAGKYDSFDQYKAAGLEASDLTGVHGNLKTFGPDWAGYGFDRQKQIVQALIDADLYKAKKGEVEVTDAVKAQALRDQILKTALPKSVSQTSAAPIDLGTTAPIITFTEGVNGTKIPVFSPSPAVIAKYEEINKAKNAKS